jgi:hypothetical protein
MTKKEAILTLETELTEVQLAICKAQAVTNLIYDEMFEKETVYQQDPCLCLQSINYLRPFTFILIDEVAQALKTLERLAGTIL